MIIVQTPLRISFFGGGSDFPEWYNQHGGKVLTSTIDKHCYLNVRFWPPFFSEKYRISYSVIEHAKSASEIKHPSAKACIERSGIKEGLEVTYNGDLPAHSGLASSSAYTVGLLNALHGLKGIRRSPLELAEEAIYLEQKVMKDIVGCQDQIEVAFGGFNLIEFENEGTFKVSSLPVSKARLARLEKNLILVYSGKSRFSSSIATDLVSNFEQKKDEIKSMLLLVDEGARILLDENADIDDFGRLLNETWERKRNLSCKISTSVLDDIYTRALRNGALGGKTLGAGGGGFMLLFVPEEKRAAVSSSLNGYLSVPFSFVDYGSRILYSAEEIPDLRN